MLRISLICRRAPKTSLSGGKDLAFARQSRQKSLAHPSFLDEENPLPKKPKQTVRKVTGKRPATMGSRLHPKPAARNSLKQPPTPASVVTSKAAGRVTSKIAQEVTPKVSTRGAQKNRVNATSGAKSNANVTSNAKATEKVKVSKASKKIKTTAKTKKTTRHV